MSLGNSVSQVETPATNVLQSAPDGAVQVIAVSGGKGGVGKSNVAINLAVSLAMQGRRTVLLDADLSLANIDVLLGIKPLATLEDVLNGSVALEDILVEGPAGVKVVPAGSGTEQLTRISPLQQGGLISAFGALGEQIDVLVIDTAAGVSDVVRSFLAAAQHLLMVVCDEPTSITDAYALMKLLHVTYNIDRFHILANMIRQPKDAERLFTKLETVTDRFLDVNLHRAGVIPFDESVRRAVRRQRAVCDLYPKSRAAAAFRELAEATAQWVQPTSASGRMEFFAERLMARKYTAA